MISFESNMGKERLKERVFSAILLSFTLSLLGVMLYLKHIHFLMHMYPQGSSVDLSSSFIFFGIMSMSASMSLSLISMNNWLRVNLKLLNRVVKSFLILLASFTILELVFNLRYENIGSEAATFGDSVKYLSAMGDASMVAKISGIVSLFIFLFMVSMGLSSVFISKEEKKTSFLEICQFTMTLIFISILMILLMFFVGLDPSFVFFIYFFLIIFSIGMEVLGFKVIF